MPAKPNDFIDLVSEPISALNIPHLFNALE
jgi:hypothetical protein